MYNNSLFCQTDCIGSDKILKQVYRMSVGLHLTLRYKLCFNPPPAPCSQWLLLWSPMLVESQSSKQRALGPQCPVFRPQDEVARPNVIQTLYIQIVFIFSSTQTSTKSWKNTSTTWPEFLKTWSASEKWRQHIKICRLYPLQDNNNIIFLCV